MTETDELVEIEFQSPFDFSSMEEMDAQRMIESFAMTAKSYGKQVQLANTEQPQWLGYDFTMPLKTPVATNNTPWTTE
ncbi:hypothetical protein FK545_19430 [Planococcus glaciei]|nr:hypothetical protein [Planococcus glaciei]QDY46722.1 hypothetical protein FK545_19430 [Planococcus glaciei]